MLLSSGDELALGQQTDSQILKSYGHYEDPALNGYISGIGKKLGVPQDKLEAHAVLNGMKLDDALPAGELVKIVVK